MSDETAPRYCSNCGTALDPPVNYCPQCGAQCRPVSADDDAPSDDFRRRVESYLVDGWEKEHDDGDRVVLANRGYGSFGTHVLVAVLTLWWTLGIGNVAYAAYSYYENPERVVLGDDADARAADGHAVSDAQVERTSDGPSIGATVGGALLAFLGIAIIASAELDPLTLLFGGMVLCLGGYTCPPVRSRLRNHHSVTDFGRTQTTDERVVRAPDRPCSVCYDAIEHGVKRTYTEDVCVAGVSLYTAESGENYYCRACARGDSMIDSLGGDDAASPADAPSAASSTSPDVVAGDAVGADEMDADETDADETDTDEIDAERN